MNVRLRKSENKAEIVEFFFDMEEAKVIGFDSGEFFGSMFQCEGENLNLRTFNAFGEIATRAFDSDMALFPRKYFGQVLNPIKDTVVNLLDDVICNGNGSTGILETMAAVITGSRWKECAISSKDVEADKAEFFSERNESMKDLLVERLSDTFMEIGKGSFTGDGILANTDKAAVILSSLRIAQDKAEVPDGRDLFKITKQIEEKERNGIVTGTTEDGISNCCNGADEREIDSRTDQMGNASANGTVVVDVDVFLSESVVGKPASFLFGESFGVPAVDKRIDFAKLSDKMSNSEARVFAHTESPGVSRECEPPSKRLPGSPF